MFSIKLAFGNFLLFALYIQDDKWFPVYEDGTIVPDEIVEVVKKLLRSRPNITSGKMGT